MNLSQLYLEVLNFDDCWRLGRYKWWIAKWIWIYNSNFCLNEKKFLDRKEIKRKSVNINSLYLSLCTVSFFSFLIAWTMLWTQLLSFDQMIHWDTDLDKKMEIQIVVMCINNATFSVPTCRHFCPSSLFIIFL